MTPYRFQRAIQCVFLGICLIIGWRFSLFCSGAPVARPSGVEGFLPISALLGLKYLLTTGRYDPAHPAGLTIFLFAILTGLFLRRNFCAFICPAGLVSNLLAGAGRKLGLARRPPGLVNALACSVKYVLLFFFLITAFFGMSGAALKAFVLGSYNLTADAHLLRFFLDPSRTALTVLAVLAVLGLVVRNAWCRWLCPYGALLGLLALTGISRIERDANACAGCGRCRRVCPADIAIDGKNAIRTPECVGCARCVGSCAKEKALAYAFLGRRVRWWFPGLAALCLFLAMWLTAVATGHWDSGLDPAMLRALYARTLG